MDDKHSDIVTLACQLMTQHGIGHWCFDFDRAKRRAGCCHYRRQTITLSHDYVSQNDGAHIKNTILHEIAHALAGPKAKHGWEWKRICILIGARPVRCYDRTVQMPKGRYKAVCGGCSKEFHRHRRVKRGRYIYCAACGPDRGGLEYRIAESFPLSGASNLRGKDTKQ